VSAIAAADEAVHAHPRAADQRQRHRLAVQRRRQGRSSCSRP
jgi:hypothetical protein